MTIRSLSLSTAFTFFLFLHPYGAHAEAAKPTASLSSSYFANEQARKDAADAPAMLAVIQEYERLAAAGHALSAYRLGDIYRSGAYVPVDLDKAISYYRMAVDLGRPAALSRLGSTLLAANHPEDAYAAYQQAIDLNVPGVSLTWAKAHAKNEFGEKSDPALGLNLLQEMWNGGDMQAGNLLADAYRYGWGGAPDLTKSAAILETLADKGDVLALEKLATYQREGYGAPVDLNRAIDLYQQAVDKGRISALLGLANTQLRAGKGPEALATYQKAADAGLAEANLEIAVGHIKKAFGDRSDVQSGVNQLRREAEAGNAAYAEAALELLADGTTFNLDVEKVIGVADQAAASGDASAAYAILRLARSKPELIGSPIKTRKDVLKKFGPLLPERTLATEEVALTLDANSSRQARPLLADLLKGYGADGFKYGLQQVFWRDKNAFTYLVQKELSKRGVYKGPADGVLSKNTVRAMLRFCRRSGFYDECIHGPMRASAMRMMVDAMAATHSADG